MLAQGGVVLVELLQDVLAKRRPGGRDPRDSGGPQFPQEKHETRRKHGAWRVGSTLKKGLGWAYSEEGGKPTSSKLRDSNQQFGHETETPLGFFPAIFVSLSLLCWNNMFVLIVESL